MNAYSGDGIQVFFPGGPVDAIEAGLEMLTEARGTIRRVTEKVRSAVDIGIGIDTGSVLIAMMGGHARIIESLDGEPVDLAPRIAAHAALLQSELMVSAATQRGIAEGHRIQLRFVEGPAIDPGGQQIQVFEVFDISEADPSGSV